MNVEIKNAWCFYFERKEFNIKAFHCSGCPSFQPKQIIMLTHAIYSNTHRER